MLLRPRKSLFKNLQKKRSLKTFKNLKRSSLGSNSFKEKKLIYGQFGLKNLTPNFLLYNKYLFRVKLFLKKTVRRSNITNRKMWIKVFPHLPITKKVIGSRMGKGKGKSSDWAAKIPSECIFIELRNVRPGRSKHFFSQIVYKLPGKHTFVSKYTHYNKLTTFSSVSYQHNSFHN